MKTEDKSRIMKIVIYTRVSTKEQVEGYSLTFQEKICRDFIEKNGNELLVVFREQGESAKTAQRPELLKMLEYCRKNKGKVDMILVYKIDRMARNAEDYQAIRATLLRYGVSIKSATEPIDSTPSGKFMENIFSSLAQFDNDVRSASSKEGLQEKVDQGMWAWQAPIGYKNIPHGLEIDENSAPFIVQAFETYARGAHTIRDIARLFNKWGIKTKKGNKFSPQTVTKILENKLYIGIIEVERWGVETEGIHDKIISPELFYKVQAIRQGRSVASAPRLVNNPIYPLKNIAKCYSCGKYLTGSASGGNGGKYPYYHCPCGKTRVPKSTFENNFFEMLKQIQPNEDFRKLFSEILLDVWKMKLQKVDSETKNAEKKLLSLRNFKDALVMKNLQGIISDEDFREQIDKMNNLITIKEVERTEIRAEQVDINALVSLSEELFKKVSTLWLEADFEHKLKFQHLLFPRGIIFKDDSIGTEELGLPFRLIDESNTDKPTIERDRGVEPLFFAWKANVEPFN